MMYIEKIPRRALGKSEYEYFAREEWSLSQPGANERQRRKRVIRLRKKQSVTNRWRRS